MCGGAGGVQVGHVWSRRLPWIDRFISSPVTVVHFNWVGWCGLAADCSNGFVHIRLRAAVVSAEIL